MKTIGETFNDLSLAMIKSEGTEEESVQQEVDNLWSLVDDKLKHVLCLRIFSTLIELNTYLMDLKEVSNKDYKRIKDIELRIKSIKNALTERYREDDENKEPQ